jgi:hypothetical protein
MTVMRERLDRVQLPGEDGGLELNYPDRLVEPVAWLGHVPFAMWLVEALGPRMIVELGVHTGNSYCAFLQSVQTLGLDTRCFGVDHWQGDEHAGYYGDEIYREFCSYHDVRYGAFSTLLRSPFDEALSYFSDGSIDLLHIDGFHTLDAVSADFRTWLPKVSSRGVALFHDINVRERGFGIWKFWETISSQYPHFAFTHSHGLGIAYLGSEPLGDRLKALFAAKPDGESERVRAYFARLGTSLVERRSALTFAADLEVAKARVAELQGKLEATQPELEAVGSKLETAQAELERARLEVARVNAEAGPLFQADEQRKEQVAILQARFEAAQSDLTRERAHTRSFLAKQEQYQERVAALQAELQASVAECEAVRSELDATKANSEALASELRAKIYTIELHAKIQKSLARQRVAISGRLQQEILALNQELADANLEKCSYERQLREVVHSKTWRMTEPARQVYLKLRRLFSTDRQTLASPETTEPL